MPVTIPPTASITIRPGYADDHAALARLAALDSAPVPAFPLLLAEVDGRLRAAVSQADGAAVGDPFFPTAELIGLLRTHGAATAGRRPPRRRAARLSFA
jgi:hypothetical protein